MYKIIKSKRNEIGLTQSQLAYEAQVSLPTIQNLEAGRANLSELTLEQILKALGLKIQVVSLDVNWEEVIPLGVPLTGASNPEPLLQAKEFIIILDHFLSTLSMKKEEMIRNTRSWEALTAFLWALDMHYAGTMKRLRYAKKVRRLLAQNLKLFELGRLIKLRRIALANLGKFL